MKQNHIDKAVKEHYQQQALAPEVMARMVAIADSVTQNSRQHEQKANFWRRRWWLQRNLSLAASVVIALLVIPWLWGDDDRLLVRVAQEVALNHNKQLSSEYVFDSYQELISVMSKLDFELVHPVRLQQAGYQITGSRYCSIQGGIAAQIQLRAGDGEIVTLYQTRLNSTLALLDGQHYAVDNIHVQTWQEGDVFFSFASAVKQGEANKGILKK
ncbi:hypothetical protein MNBD_GAMMA26-503, partial [hydrothermal vent metagenome]